MPFTFAHPAVVLPFNYLPRKWRSLTGLVAGAMVPDFEYFFRAMHLSRYSHTLSGLFWFDLPVGLVIVFVFHNIMRDPLIRNMPGILQKRCSHFYAYPWNQTLRQKWPILLLSILVGAATHLLWDGFTHETADTLKSLPFKDDFHALTKGKVKAYNLYSELSSVLGALIMCYAIWQLPVRGILPKDGRQTTYWSWIFVSTAVIFFTLRALGYRGGLEGNLIVLIDALLISIIWVSIAMYKIPGKYNRTNWQQL